MENKKEMTIPNVSAATDAEQSLSKCTDNSIVNQDTDFKGYEQSFEEMQREILRQLDPSYLKTVSMTTLYDTVFEVQTPLIDGLLQRGTYLFVGSPKVGKSFMMAQLAYHISTGTPLWEYKVRKATVLYFALEDDYPRLQKRLFQMFGAKETGNLYFATECKTVNPQLRVFSAHLHMDEATPHLHIDFVPFTTGSKRGLDTRVSLKQALATQGFKGGSRGDTEWSQWIQSEKEQLAAVMERYGIEWEHLGTHEKHLSVLDYKKQEREKEVAALGAKIEQKQIEFDVLSERVLNYDKAKDELSNLEIELDTAPKYQLPEPEKFMTAKAYKTKMAEPVVRKLKQLVKTVLARCFEGWDNYHRLNTANAQLYRTNQRLEKVNERLTEENKILKAENKDYSLLRKVFGRKQIDDLLEQARTVKGRKRDNTRSR